MSTANRGFFSESTMSHSTKYVRTEESSNFFICGPILKILFPSECLSSAQQRNTLRSEASKKSIFSTGVRYTPEASLGADRHGRERAAG